MIVILFPFIYVKKRIIVSIDLFGMLAALSYGKFSLPFTWFVTFGIFQMMMDGVKWINVDIIVDRMMIVKALASACALLICLVGKG